MISDVVLAAAEAAGMAESTRGKMSEGSHLPIDAGDRPVV